MTAMCRTYVTQEPSGLLVSSLALTPCAALKVGYIDDPRGPIGLAGIVVLALTAILILEVMDFVQALKARP